MTHFVHGQELPLYVDPVQSLPGKWILVDSRYLMFGPVLQWPLAEIENIFSPREYAMMLAWQPRPPVQG